MAKSPAKKTAGLADIELHSDAWKRFESFVKTSVPKAKPTASRPKTSTRKASKKA